MPEHSDSATPVGRCGASRGGNPKGGDLASDASPTELARLQGSSAPALAWTTVRDPVRQATQTIRSTSPNQYGTPALTVDMPVRRVGRAGRERHGPSPRVRALPTAQFGPQCPNLARAPRARRLGGTAPGC